DVEHRAIVPGAARPRGRRRASKSAVGGLLVLARRHRGGGGGAVPAEGLGVAVVLAVSLLVVLLEAALELLDAGAEVLHQPRDLAAAAEQEHDHRQDDEPVPDAKATHAGHSP